MHGRRQGELRQGRDSGPQSLRRVSLRRGDQGVRRLIARAAILAICLAGYSACLGVIPLKPELRAAAVRNDALGLADGLEKLIDEERATNQDREAAYDAVRGWQDKTGEYAYARASLAGRLAEIKGLSAVGLIAEMEKWARVSVALNPRFREGAGRRMLGTLYVLAPASLLKYGDSEEGLELLEKQVEKHPHNPVNHLRLAEGYVALDDHEGAFEPLCYCINNRAKLRPSEQRLLETLITVVGGKETLSCGG